MCYNIRISGFTGGAEFAVTPQLLLRRPTFSTVPECLLFVGANAHIGPFPAATGGSVFNSDAVTVPPAARPHKLQATLRSAYVRLSQSRGAKLALLEPHAIPRPAASGRSRPFRCSSSPNCKRFAGLQFGSICLARKSRQKDALGDALYCALTRANFGRFAA